MFSANTFADTPSLIVAGFVAFTLCLGFCHQIVARLKKAKLNQSEALRRTFDLAQKSGSESRNQKLLKRVKIYIIPDPEVYGLTVASVGRRGAIFLSQGLISSVKESQSRELIALTVNRLKRRGSVLRSFCLIMSLILFSGMPRAWRGFLENSSSHNIAGNQFPNALSMMCFWIVLPVYKFFAYFGRPLLFKIENLSGGLVYRFGER